jgi:hypothetical protein
VFFLSQKINSLTNHANTPLFPSNHYLLALETFYFSFDFAHKRRKIRKSSLIRSTHKLLRHSRALIKIKSKWCKMKINEVRLIAMLLLSNASVLMCLHTFFTFIAPPRWVGCFNVKSHPDNAKCFYFCLPTSSSSHIRRH